VCWGEPRSQVFFSRWRRCSELCSLPSTMAPLTRGSLPCAARVMPGDALPPGHRHCAISPKYSRCSTVLRANHGQPETKHKPLGSACEVTSRLWEGAEHGLKKPACCYSCYAQLVKASVH
jgi:hypothetical protein